MPSSARCALAFVGLTLLLVLPAQGQTNNRNRYTVGHVPVNCCPTVSSVRIGEAVTECYIQPEDTFNDCPIKAYILVSKNRKYCVDPNAVWLPERLKKLENRGIICQPLTGPTNKEMVQHDFA